MTTNPKEESVVETIEPLLLPSEAAEQLRVPESWLYAAARRGTFPSVRIGRYVRFRQDDVTDWIRTGGEGDD